jgi:hypothetical protein
MKTMTASTKTEEAKAHLEGEEMAKTTNTAKEERAKERVPLEGETMKEMTNSEKEEMVKAKVPSDVMETVTAMTSMATEEAAKARAPTEEVEMMMMTNTEKEEMVKERVPLERELMMMASMDEEEMAKIVGLVGMMMALTSMEIERAAKEEAPLEEEVTMMINMEKEKMAKEKVHLVGEMMMTPADMAKTDMAMDLLGGQVMMTGLGKEKTIKAKGRLEGEMMKMMTNMAEEKTAKEEILLEEEEMMTIMAGMAEEKTAKEEILLDKEKMMMATMAGMAEEKTAKEEILLEEEETMTIMAGTEEEKTAMEEIPLDKEMMILVAGMAKEETVKAEGPLEEGVTTMMTNMVLGKAEAEELMMMEMADSIEAMMTRAGAPLAGVMAVVEKAHLAGTEAMMANLAIMVKNREVAMGMTVGTPKAERDPVKEDLVRTVQVVMMVIMEALDRGRMEETNDPHMPEVEVMVTAETAPRMSDLVCLEASPLEEMAKAKDREEGTKIATAEEDQTLAAMMAAAATKVCTVLDTVAAVTAMPATTKEDSHTAEAVTTKTTLAVGLMATATRKDTHSREEIADRCLGEETWRAPKKSMAVPRTMRETGGARSSGTATTTPSTETTMTSTDLPTADEISLAATGHWLAERDLSMENTEMTTGKALPCWTTMLRAGEDLPNTMTVKDDEVTAKAAAAVTAPTSRSI